MTLREPLLSRALVVAAPAVAAAGTVVLVLSYRSGNGWLDGLGLGWFLLLILLCVTAGILSLRNSVSSRGRPARFLLTGNGFGAPSLVSPGLMALMLSMLASNSVASTVNRWRDLPFAIFLTLLTVPMVILVVVLLRQAWHGFQLELSPAGITWRHGIFRRTIPWEALWVGGPARPAHSAGKIVLAVKHPDLVTQRGLSLGSGSRSSPTIALQLAIHPWFLADAIRWYVEHPEHRPAIGTAAEHDRLLASLHQ